MQILIGAMPWMLGGSGAALLWSLASASHPSLFAVLCISSATLLSNLYLIWFLRDGMGPDAVTSTAVEGAQRVGIGAAVAIGIWLLVNGLALARYRSHHHRGG